MADVTIAKYSGGTTNATVQQRAPGAVFPSTSGILGTGAALTAGQTFDIDVEFNDDVILYLEDTSAGANSITLDAGTYPTSPKKVLGAATIAMVISDVITVVPVKARHLNASGHITGSMAAAGRIWVLMGPAGFIGKMPTNPA